jgi:hypothetical protein
MNNIKISITKYPSSDQVRISIQENRNVNTVWMTTEAYRQLGLNIQEDIAQEAVEHIPAKGKKYEKA